jgi:hypothetical protein
MPSISHLLSRRNLLLAAMACLAILLVSMSAMARKIEAFNSSAQRTLWMLKAVDSRAFLYGGREVTLTDQLDQEGREAVLVRYGEQELLVPATIPPLDPRLPNLVRHQDWMRVLRFAQGDGATGPDFDRLLAEGKIVDRLAIVVRRPLADDPRTLGQGWKRQWVFDFYEFLPEGGFATQTWSYPSGRTIDKPKPGHLEEGTWQYSAALSVMPKLRKPNPKFTNDALHSLQWTLPAAAFSGLGLFFAIFMLVSPSRRARWGGAAG